MRGRYVVLVVLIVGAWWMHRRTGDAEAVAPPAPKSTAPTRHTVVVSTPRPELPPATTPEPTHTLSGLPSPYIDVPQVNVDIEEPIRIEIEKSILDEVNEHPLIRYNDVQIDFEY